MSIASLIWIAHGSRMAGATKVNFYLRIRRWVDRDLASRSLNTIAHVFGLIPILVAALAQNVFEQPVTTVVWTVAIGLCVAWTAFIVWRGVRLIKAGSIKGDREFDQTGKFLLSPEYHRSESVTATLQRKRKKRRRARSR